MFHFTELPLDSHQAAVCFLVFPLRCVFAPLNPAFTVPEIEFEFQDLPCHTVVVMDGEDNSATLQVGRQPYTEFKNVGTCRGPCRPQIHGVFGPSIHEFKLCVQGRRGTESASLGDAAKFQNCRAV